jgi:hypothetical protein
MSRFSGFGPPRAILVVYTTKVEKALKKVSKKKSGLKKEDILLQRVDIWPRKSEIFFGKKKRRFCGPKSG